MQPRPADRRVRLGLSDLMTKRWWMTRWGNLTAPVDDDNRHRRVAVEGGCGRRIFGDWASAGLTCGRGDPYRRPVCALIDQSPHRLATPGLQTAHARSSDVGT